MMLDEITNKRSQDMKSTQIEKDSQENNHALNDESSDEEELSWVTKREEGEIAFRKWINEIRARQLKRDDISNQKNSPTTHQL